MNREILRLAIPSILSNISVPLLSTVDTALMGRLSEVHIGAVGVGSMIFNFIYWNFGFLRMGTTGITAQAFGKQDDESITNTLARAMIVSLLVSSLILALQIPFAKASFFLMNVGAEQRELVNEYFFIRIWAAPATLGLIAFMGWFFGMQNAIYPLALTIVINVANIVLSYLFVWHLGMDVAGVAWGTVLAQYIGLLVAVFLFCRKYGSYLKHYSRQAVLKLEELSRFLAINRDIFIRTVCLTFAFGFFYSQSSASGKMILAVNVILMQYLNWMSFAVDGFAFASEILVGKYSGAENASATRKAIRFSFAWGMLMAALFSLFYWVFGEQLLAVFTNQQAVIQAAIPFLFWMIILPVLGTPSYIWDGVFIGLTASKAMRNSMLLALVVFLVSFFILNKPLGNDGLWLALVIFLVARGGFQWVLFLRKGLTLK